MLAERAGRIATVADDESGGGGDASSRLRASTSSTSARGSRIFRRRAHISDAAKAAIDANFTKYTTNSGTEELKRAVARALQGPTTASSTRPSEIIITAGGKQALYNAAMVLFGPGDEVITHMPGWPTLVEQIKLAEATPVIVHTHAEDGFSLRAETILSRRSRRGRAASSSTRPATRPAR